MSTKKEVSTALSTQQNEVLESFVMASKSVASFSGKTVTALSDGRLSTAEIFSLVFSAPEVLSAISAASKNIRSWIYFEEFEKKSVVSAFAAEFDIENDVAEQRIELVIESIERITTNGEKIVKQLKKLQKGFAKTA